MNHSICRKCGKSLADQDWMEKLLTPGIENILVSGYKKLAVGCKIHPAYRVTRKPATDCKRCKSLWNLKKDLEVLENAEKLKWKQFQQNEAAERKKWTEHQDMLKCCHQ